MSPLSLLLALSLLCAAALSDTLGQSAVLFLNRVPPRRFLFCVLAGALTFLSAAACWTASLWLLGGALGFGLSLARCFWLVALAHAPLLMGWATLLPYLGGPLFQLLRAAVFLQLVVTTGVASGASLGWVTLACAPGYAIHFTLTHLDLLRWLQLERWWRART